MSTTAITTNGKYYPTFVATFSGVGQALYDASGLFYNPSGGALTTAVFYGSLSGNHDGVVASTATGTQQPEGNNTTAIATTNYVDRVINKILLNYSNIMSAGGILIGGLLAGTRVMNNAGQTMTVGGSSATYPPATIYLNSADFAGGSTINSISPLLRISGGIIVNNTAPASSFTIGLYPVSNNSGTGTASLIGVVLGTVVSGSNGLTFTTPAAKATTNGTSATFSFPPAGMYCLAAVSTATIATSSVVGFNFYLQVVF
jgi:hypothetical protein